LTLLYTSDDSGIIGASGIAVCSARSLHGASMPITATLKSALAGRKIELSTDEGIEYFSPTVDTTTPTMLVLSIGAPVSHIRFTGSSGDTWSVR
jgi:hypothetical protein